MALIVAAIVAVVVLVGGNGGAYSVTAQFDNASQLVKGNLVQTGGRPIGEVTDLKLSDDGRAEVKLKIDDDYAPLREGTRAIVRQASLSGVANRYVDLQLAPDGRPAIADGGMLRNTSSAVDLDQLFNVFDKNTREALQDVIKGSNNAYAGTGRQAGAGWAYLNPSLAASSRLFAELDRDEPLLERFVVESSKLVTDLADRRDDVAGLVDHLADTTNAIGAEHDALGEAIQRLPGFMRRSNTTFLNLRATLDDLDPLVRDSKPAARELRPLLADLRPFARDARPTLRDVSRLVKSSGADNDLIELTRAAVPLRDIAIRGVNENGKQREGAFPASTRALKSAAPELDFARPYATDLLGWFDDFSHSGVYDALGAASRAAPHASAFAFANGQLSFVPPELRAQLFNSVASLNQNNRCPGSAEHIAEDGSNLYVPSPGYNCDPTQVLPGS